MRKEHLFGLIGGAILAIILLSYNCNGKDKHYIVKLKGHVLYAGHSDKKIEDKVPGSAQIVVTHTEKTAPLPALQISNRQVVAVEQTPVSKVIEKSSCPVTSNTDFAQQLENIHSKVFEMFPGTYLDSVSIVNQLLNDSIRHELSGINNSERSEYLKLCLTSSMHDSITLSKLSKLSTDDASAHVNQAGVVVAHCKDASNSAGMDSVVMDVFSGSTLMASASSDKNGTIECKGIPEGNYYVVFSRRAYAPFSLMRVKVSGFGQSYIDAPLSRQDGYFFRTFGKHAWLFVVSGVIFILLILTLLAYYLAKINARRSLHTA